jgi:hypothetical protein
MTQEFTTVRNLKIYKTSIYDQLFHIFRQENWESGISSISLEVVKHLRFSLEENISPLVNEE